MSGWIWFVIGAVAGGCLGYGCAALVNISGQESRKEEAEIMDDWRSRQFIDFAEEKGVEILIQEDWRCRRLAVVMKQGDRKAEAFIEYEDLACFLPTPFLNGLYRDLMEEVGDG